MPKQGPALRPTFKRVTHRMATSADNRLRRVGGGSERCAQTSTRRDEVLMFAGVRARLGLGRSMESRLLRVVKLVVLFVARALGGFWLARRLTQNRLRILCYHGFELLDEASFRNKLFVRGSTFERRLATLRRVGMHVLPLGEAVERLYRGHLPRNALVITVDDGFHSVAQVALPRLRRHGFPATVYVTTYHVRHATPVFSLAVQYMFWKTSRAMLDLQTIHRDMKGSFDLRIAADRSAATDTCDDFGRGLESETERQQLCRAIGRELQVSYDDICASKILSLMDEADCRELAAAGVDVELHTHRHRFPVNDKTQALREIEDNRTALRAVSAGDKRHFCYPSGLWDARQWAWLDEAGVLSSTTCLPGLNDANTPRHALRRFLDGENIHQLEFESAVSGFSEFLAVLRDRLAAVRASSAPPRPSLVNDD